MHILTRILKWLALLLLILYGSLIAYAYWPAPPGEPVEKLATPADLFITVDDIQLRYRTWGNQQPDKPNLVLLHGFANSVQTFERIAPLLTDQYFVAAVDLPGFGLSEKPTDHNYGNASQARVISDFIAAMKMQEVIVGGHSMGGALALHVSEQTPQVTGMVMLNPGIITTGVPPITSYLFFPLPRLAAKIFGQREFRENFLRKSFLNTDLITEESMDAMMLGPRSDDYLSGATTLMSYYKEGDEIKMLANVRVPTLLVWGNQDRGKPPGEAELLQSMITGSELVRVADAGHYVHEEQPQKVADALLSRTGFWATRR